jgi:3-carboxy-cis,cis-muconate cycloisomerase
MTEPSTEASSLSLTTPLFASAAMRAVFDDRARLQRMLEFEAKLSRAQASLGIVSASAVDAIVQACDPEFYDVAAIAAAAGPAGNIAVPLVEALSAEVAKSAVDAAQYVHWGASDLDVIDTALVMELRAVIDVLTADLDRAIAAFAALASKYRRQAMAARTSLQHALPIPFGLRVAGYAAALARARARLLRLRKEVLVLQFGGAAGTLAVLGENAFQVSQRLSALLDLTLPDAPWHSHRDRVAEVAACLAILAGTCGKIGRDVALMMQTDVAEAFEPAAPGRCTVPQMRKPLAAATAIAAATTAPNLAATIFAAQVQEHERAADAGMVEWSTFPLLALVTSGALANIVAIAEGIEINAERMRRNLDATGGLIMAEHIAIALAAKVGKAQADALIEEAIGKAIAEKHPFEEVLAADERVSAHLSPAKLTKLFEPLANQGAAQIFIERQVAALITRAAKRE